MSQARHVSTDRTFVTISAAAVVIAAIAGFWLLGSPNQQRLLSLDSERISDLSQIASELAYDGESPIDNSSAPPLPAQLPEAVTARDDLRDPLTGDLYEYRRLSDTAYELCATFATDASEQRSNSRFVDVRWRHPAGYHCFEIEKSATQPKS
ncbi:MAG: hypothetical protein WBC73_09090 [Phormidesmis sp.]